MGIWLIAIIWMLTAGVFVLAVCSAAARPIPKPTTERVNEQRSVNSEITIQAPSTIKFTPIAAMLVLLAIFTTSCAAIPPGSHPVNFGRSEPVKGATLLMDHSR